MIAGKIALASGAFAASLLSGVSIGSYTIGGFRMHQPIDIIAEMASNRSREAFVQEPLPQAPIAHVCKGCDAKLYRDVDWDQSAAAYLSDEGAEDEGRWSVADDPVPADAEPVAAQPVAAQPVTGSAGDKARDGNLAAYEAPVIVAAGPPQG